MGCTFPTARPLMRRAEPMRILYLLSVALDHAFRIIAAQGKVFPRSRRCRYFVPGAAVEQPSGSAFASANHGWI